MTRSSKQELLQELLQPRPMSAKEIADLIARAKANTTPVAISTGVRTRARFERMRVARSTFARIPNGQAAFIDAFVRRGKATR